MTVIKIIIDNAPQDPWRTEGTPAPIRPPLGGCPACAKSGICGCVIHPNAPRITC